MAGRTRRRGAENPFVTYCVTNGRGRDPAEPGSGERAELVAVGLAALEPGDDLEPVAVGDRGREGLQLVLVLPQRAQHLVAVLLEDGAPERGVARGDAGGVAQAELLGVFAREGLDFAFYWYAPEPNSSPWFGFKMFRNPDGNHTAFGDRYLPATVSAPTDVSVHAARDSQTGRITLVLVNKRAAKDAQVTLKFSEAVPRQDVTVYEYSAADRFAIGRRPVQTVAGHALTVDLPSLSVLRFDLNP